MLQTTRAPTALRQAVAWAQCRPSSARHTCPAPATANGRLTAGPANVRIFKNSYTVYVHLMRAIEKNFYI